MLTPRPICLAGAGRPWRRLLCALALTAASAASSAAQSLTPRAYWPLPRGTKVISVGWSYQQGDVLTDPSLPIEGAEAKALGLQAGYLHFFSLAGRTASLSVELPWTDASLDGLVEGEARGRDLSGLSDLGLRLAVNLLGAPSMTRAELAELIQNPRPILGASLRIQAPTGVYESDRFVNLGSNRWSVKPELGYIRHVRSGWTAEIALGAWFFGDNRDFLGQIREQDPLAAAELHLWRPVRPHRPDFWASLDFNFAHGGRTRVDGEEKNDLQRNSRLGLTVAIPLARGHAIKLAASTSLATEVGGELTSLVVGYLKAWK